MTPRPFAYINTGSDPHFERTFTRTRRFATLEDAEQGINPIPPMVGDTLTEEWINAEFEEVVLIRKKPTI